jgi:obg-like ATPase 1
MGVPAENFPFCTIDPATSRVNVPDERFDKLVEKFKPKSAVKAFLEVTDIAGYVFLSVLCFSHGDELSYT